MEISKDCEETFKYLLQKTVNFIVNDKVIKKGKILLFNQNDFNIEFTLEDGRDFKIRKYNIPIPFKVEMWSKDGLVYCDYRLNTLAQKNKELKHALEKMNSDETASKFFNSILQIEVKDNE